MDERSRFRVSADAVRLHTSPATLPEAALGDPSRAGAAGDGHGKGDGEANDGENGVDEGVARAADPVLGIFDLLKPVVRRALDIGITAREPSFHVFVAADPEVSIEDDIVRYAERVLARKGTPMDIVYVHDFDRPEAPRPLLLPAGAGPELATSMQRLVERLREDVPQITESEPVKAVQAHHTAELEAKNKALIEGLETTARGLGFGVRSVKGGVQTFPMLHGKPVSAEQFDVLDDATRRALQEAEDRLTREMEKASASVRAHGDQIDQARDQALSQAAEALVDDAMADVARRFSDLGGDVNGWLEQVRRALIVDWEDLIADEEDEDPSEADDEGGASDDDPELATRLRRFRVNVLVAHVPGEPPPVLYETNPTYPKLFGYLERRARFGALLTDFTRIRPGSLQAASGGVLVVRAADLLQDPIIWERMKRVLRERRIGAEDPLGPLGLYATTLRPVPAPIRVRVVLVGSQELYTQLLDADPDFAALFRVKVEIDPSVPRTTETMHALDGYLMAMARDREWGAFDRPARARMLDIATRLAGDRDKISLLLAPLEETAALASALADGRTVTDVDVDTAWRERRDRLGSAERHIRELTLRGDVALETGGARVGVVNALSVYSTGDVEFGQPMRITAVVGIGREGIVDVEREAQLGGAFHTKGVAILRGYLTRLFGQERPLSIRAQLAFEQSYGEVDGDSASSSELFAVLSALADVPIDQGVAVTGSVNQLGEMQAIGGAAAKVEGFFDLCQARGLTGGQGVLIPRTNLPHLVLRQDVVDALEAGTFHVWAVNDVAQGITILTGVPAGVRDPNGRFPAASVFGRVERRIIEIAERLRKAEGHSPYEARETAEESAAEVEGGDFRIG